MKRRTLIFGTLGLAALGFLVFAGWFVLYRDTSIYAHGFTQDAFERVEAGMTQDEVRQLLGEPLGVKGGAWYYSDPSSYGVYHARIVVFSEEEAVARIVSYVMHD